MKNYTSYFYFLVATVLFSIDRITKYLVMHFIPSYTLNSYMHIELVLNRGISFGIFHSTNSMIFSAVNLLIGAVICMLMMHTYKKILLDKPIIGEICIFTGACSNVYDRLLHAGVVDFIALSYQNWHFAVFNFADACICCGAIIMLAFEYNYVWKK